MKRLLLFFFIVFAYQGVGSQTTLSEGFESWPLADWTLYELGDALDGWRDTFDGNVHTGDKAAYAAIDNAQCDHWMVTPQIEIVNADYVLRFWELSGTIDIDYYDKATVLVSTGSGDPTSGEFVEVFETGLNTDDFAERLIDLSAYSGETIYVAFRYQGTFHRWYIDDVSIAPEIYVDGDLTEILSPTGVSETPVTLPVSVELQNTGTMVLNDFSVMWAVNDIPQTEVFFTGQNLGPGQALELELGDYFFNAEDYYDIKATLVLANDFDSSNDMVFSTFEIASFKDGEIVAISPEGLVPNAGNREVNIEVRNVGENTINRAEVEWQVDGVTQPSFVTSGLDLQVDESTIINLGQFDFATGIHTISANLNALGDIDESNDAYTASISVDVFYESFEGVEFPPEDWSIVFGVRDGINFGTAADGEFYYVSSVDDNFFGEISDTLFTPLLDIEAGDRFNFFIQSSLATPATHVLVWKNGTTGEVSVIQNISPSSGFFNWEERSISISAAAGTNYIGIISTSNGSYGETRFDFFTSDASLHLFDRDLKIRDAEIDFIAKQNETEQFACKIRNAGALPVAGDEYTLKLMAESGEEVASVSGVDLQSWQEAIIAIEATFDQISTRRLYFELDYPADQNLGNNTFRSTLVGVVPNTVVVDEIGSPDLRNANIPFTPNGNTNSLGEDDLTQSLYYAEEFATTGQVHGIVYKYDNLLNANVVKDYPLQVWITQTDLETLDDGWLPQEELILVFDGLVDILPGNDRDLYIPFDEPVSLNGIDNVVIQNYQYDPVWPPAIFRIFSTNLGADNPTRSIGVFDVFDLDPASPPSFFASLADIPYTRFVVAPVVSTSLLSGVVYNTEDNQPIANALVAISGSSQMALTDASGAYSFPALQYGSYSINVTADGFQNLSTQIELNADNQVQDFYLTPLEEFQLTGTVFGDNNPSVPLGSVEVALIQDNEIVDQTTTDGNGDFVFPIIYGGFSYELRFNFYGYEEEVISVANVSADVDLNNVIMAEEFISPFDVQVGENGPTVVWKSPKLSSKGKLRHDSGTISTSYTNEPNENVWLGNFYALEERTTITDVEIQTDIFPNAEDFVRIDIFDLESEEILASSEPFLIYADSLHIIDVPNIVVSDSIALMLHWENNPVSTNALAIDFSSEDVFNGAVIKEFGQPITLLSEYFGDGAPNMAFHIRAITLEDGNPITNGEAVSYNVYRGLASEFPETSNWSLLNTSPVAELSFAATDNTGVDPAELYRYAVETIYNDGASEVTFSNSIFIDVVSVDELQSDAAITIYPVPTRDYLTVELAPDLSVGQYTIIFNAVGKQVMAIAPSQYLDNKAVVDTSVLPNGLYFITVKTPGATITKKFEVVK